MSFQDVTFLSKIPLKEAQLAFIFESSSISKKKNAPLLSKKPSCQLFGRNTIYLKERFYSPKRKLDQLPLLKITPCLANMYNVTLLSITPFLWKYVTLLSKNCSCALLGRERHHIFEGKVSFTKNIILKPQRLHTWKGKLHIPKEYCACLACNMFFK